jgi:hypothetical protein
MFPLPYQGALAWLLYALFGLDVLLLASGLAVGRFDPAQMGRLPLRLRMSLSAILVFAALLQWRLAHPPLSGYAGWVFLGMAFGLLGDLIMAGLVWVPDRLVFGMLVFGLGHIYYVVALAGIATALGLWAGSLSVALWALVAAAAFVLWHRFVRKPRGDRTLNLGALVYSLLLATLNAFALSLASRDARFIPLAAGALLFLASDLVLGNWNIRGRTWKGVNDVVWVTYNLGQLLIVYSVAAAINVAAAACPGAAPAPGQQPWACLACILLASGRVL